MQRIHETYATHPNYQDILRLCQYDLIEGKGYLYNHQPSLQPTVLKFGLHEQSIKRCEWVEAGLLIHGTGFNIDSQLYLDDKKMETIFMSETQLFISTERKEIKKVTLKQLSRRHHVLGEAIDFIIGRWTQELTIKNKSARLKRNRKRGGNLFFLFFHERKGCESMTIRQHFLNKSAAFYKDLWVIALPIALQQLRNLKFKYGGYVNGWEK